ncbi:MAG: glutamate mutase L, partial [Planctomycetota bacterium]|jgi:hypothetical protein
MSYNISNVMVEAGIPNVLRWVPFEVDEQDLRDRIKNKMIRPTTIPQALEELMIEQAIAREALRLALDQHRMLAVGLKGVQKVRTIGDIFSTETSGETLVKMDEVDLIIGSGGVLSHAPRRNQSMMMMIDAYQPTGLTQLAVDSIFMMPHLGVLSNVHPEAAIEVFERDCIVPLGPCIAPKGAGKPGQTVMQYTIRGPKGEKSGELKFGEIRLFPLAVEEAAVIEIHPGRGLNVGEGPGKPQESRVKGGVVGIVLDGRGRPLQISEDGRTEKLKEWFSALNAYPEQWHTHIHRASK